MDNVNIVVHKRDVSGSRASRRMRREGLIPGVLYGHGKDAVLIAVEPHTLREALSTDAGTHAILNVTFEGQKRGHKAIVKEMALDRVKHNVIHFDLQEIRLDETIETTVAVRFEGESRGVKAGGMLEEAIREVTVKGVVTGIPEHLVMDITELDVNATLKVADLQVPEGIEVLDDPEEVLCSVLPPRKVAVEEVAGEGEEVLEAEAAAEPELVGQKEEEGED
jgi:large subunit ribosomal protein L25